MTGPVRILTVLPLLGHPRDSKRIAMLRSEGFEVEVAAFKRRYHEGRMPDCPVTIIGEIDHGRYLKRSLTMLRALPRLRKKMRSADVIYTSGADLGLMALLAGLLLAKPVIIEIGDIREVQTQPGLIGMVARLVDRTVSRAAALLVVTTPGFDTEYYGKWLNIDTPRLVVENKLEPGIPPADPLVRPADGSGIKIGYFGMLRCSRSWETLERLAQERPDVSLVVGGIVFGPEDLQERLAKLPNAQWVGEYKSPGDLPKLYGGVDLIWASPFPGPDEQNWRWARSNRFYESCHFRRPPVVYLDSGDGHAVRRHEIGLEIGRAGLEEDLQVLKSLNIDDLRRWQKNMESLDSSVYTYTDESRRLRDAVFSVANREGMAKDQ